MADLVAGAATAIGAIVTFGSFGVPIKSRRLQDAQVHPLVVQGYKSAACFATCWVALFVVKLKFTWWGIVGASIWVVNGVAAVVAIQAAGLAVSQALWSGLSVFVSFIWGAVVFHEPIANWLLALAGLVLMAAGMAAIGVVTGNAAHLHPDALMGSPDSKAKRSPQPVVHLEPGTSDSQRGSIGSAESLLVDEEAAQVLVRANNTESPAVRSVGLLERSSAHSARAMSCLADGEPHPVSAVLPQHSPNSPATALLVSDEMADWEAGQRQRRWPGYRVGIGCAVVIGISNGSFLVNDPIDQISGGRPHRGGAGNRNVPLKYANQTVTGLEYLVSFGIGAAAVTVAVAAVYSAVAHRFRWQRLRLKVRQAGPPALLAGLLWSAGNFFSIVATQKLGLAVAWPVVQVQLLVSTVWGAAWYREVRSARAGAALLGASANVVAGVACLARGKGL